MLKRAALTTTLSILLSPLAYGENMKGADTKELQGNVKKFQSAYFGSREAAVKQAIVTDFNVKESDIKVTEDARSGTRILEVSLPSFEPLEVPATVRYLFGYKCQCLNQVNVDWKLPELMTAEKRDVLMMAVSKLVKRLSEKDWLADQVTTDRAIDDVKAGPPVPFVF
ncbi:hypothetical protein [Pseudomonas sp. LB3P25]